MDDEPDSRQRTIAQWVGMFATVGAGFLVYLGVIDFARKMGDEMPWTWLVVGSLLQLAVDRIVPE
jgi:hypothetical protein